MSMDGEVLATCHPDEIVDAIGQLHGLGNAARYQLMKMCVAYDARELWKQDGANSMAEWLCMKLAWSLKAARELVEVAHALKGLPAIAAAYEAGALSFDQVRALVRCATPETDEAWVEKAREMSLAQLEAWVRRAREVKAQETAANHRRRSLSWRWNVDESWLAIRGRLPADQGAVVVKALERVAAQAPPLPSGVYEDFESRAADALVELAGISVGRDTDADRATVVVHVDHDALVGDGAAELEGGVALDPAVARRLCCDARIQVMAHGRNGGGFGVGRTARSVPPWLQREIRRRDRGCRFPGCNRTTGVAAHHLDWWGSGPWSHRRRQLDPSVPKSIIVWCTRASGASGAIPPWR